MVVLGAFPSATEEVLAITEGAFELDSMTSQLPPPSANPLVHHARASALVLENPSLLEPLSSRTLQNEKLLQACDAQGF